MFPRCRTCGITAGEVCSLTLRDGGMEYGVTFNWKRKQAPVCVRNRYSGAERPVVGRGPEPMTLAPRDHMRLRKPESGLSAHSWAGMRSCWHMVWQNNHPSFLYYKSAALPISVFQFWPLHFPLFSSPPRLSRTLTCPVLQRTLYVGGAAAVRTGLCESVCAVAERVLNSVILTSWVILVGG